MTADHTPALDTILKAILHHAPDGVLLIDGYSKVLFYNQRFLDLWGFSGRSQGYIQGEEMVAHAMQQLVDPDEFLRLLRHYLDEANRQLEGIDLLEMKNGRVLERHTSPLFDEFGNYFGRIWYFRDITAQKLAEAQIRHLAFYDALTALPNRRLLHDRLTQAMAQSRRNRLHLALMFLDMDGFKPLNDQYGHSVGDLLLVEVAQRLCNCVREADTVARFGGDEFVVLLGGLELGAQDSRTKATLVAEKIRQAVAEPYVLHPASDNHTAKTVEHRCTVSIGVVLFIDHEASPDDVIKWADLAMYEAKAVGPNQIRFYQKADLGASSAEQLTLPIH